jgi:phytoene dehydrogenase-like protein
VIRTGAAVRSIQLEENRATGVILADGETISAQTVVSNADPRRTFFDLVGAAHLPMRFVRAVKNIRFRGCTAKVNLALDGLPEFNGWDGNLDRLSGHIIINPNLNYLEQAFDAAKYGRFSEQPYLDMVLPTLLDPSLAPAGQHLLSITMQYAPSQLRDGDWSQQREQLGDQVVETLRAYSPGLKDQILDRQVLTPLDLETQFGLTEGSIYHGQMTPDQMFFMRPVAGWSQYRSPIDGLYLCGAGTHPGGGLTGAPGFNAAREILRDIT